jgi:outer membrane protein assembly factor BamB
MVRWTLCITLCAGAVQAEDWLRFRGPNGQGHVADTGYPLTWSKTEHIKWRVELPGPGNSSPIVVGNKVFLTQATEQGQKRSLLCFDRTNGQRLWEHTIPFGKVEETHKTNPYCSATPTSDGERVVVWHGSAGTHCYDLNGTLLWSRDLGEFHHIWGEASSPVIHGEYVYQICGPGERTFVICLNRQTGETVWQSPMEPGGSVSSNGRYVGTWASPVFITLNGKEQLLCALHTRVVAYDPLTGQELWSTSGISSSRGDLVYTSPLVTETDAVLFGGYGGPALGFRLGGTGDVTEPNRNWINPKEWNPQRIGSGVIVNGNVYMANADETASVECLDVKTGEQHWVTRRTNHGAHWGSMVQCEGRLYVTGQRGVTHVFAPNAEEHEVLADNDLGEESNSTPAFSNGDIFLRTFQALYCIAD